MTTLTTRVNDVHLHANSGKTGEFHIFKNEELVGLMKLRDLSGMGFNQLDDVYEDEIELIQPHFLRLQKKNAYYLDEIIINEEWRNQGIGQQVIGNLLKEKRPVLLYSLADAEEFWEMLSFENIFGYYYMWNPTEGA